ncbi:MAG TPA: hypothetical protein VIO15_10845, partial [Bacteroidales bacterium]
MKTIIAFFNRTLGVDKAIAFTMAARIIQGVGGILSIVLIATHLNTVQQGFYYTFASLLALQVFFELGLSTLITQYAAHEVAHLRWHNNELVGEKNYIERLSSLFRFTIKWYSIVSILVFFGLFLGGTIFFKINSSNLSWLGPWILLVFATSLNLFLSPILAFCEGIGYIKEVAKIRVVQQILSFAILWTSLILNFGLYSSGLSYLFSALV